MIREDRAKAASTIMNAPKPMLMATRAARWRTRAPKRFHSPEGSMRSARTKAIREIVSTSIWVRARSGAPRRANSREMP